jgi:hypothetical protein
VGKITRKLDKVDHDGRDAVTNPERIPRWFLPVSRELKLGGRYQLEGNAGGVIECCERPRLVAITWEMRGNVGWVTVNLTEQDGATRLTLEHVAHMPEEIFDQFGPGGAGVGWDLGLMALELHLKRDDRFDPEQADAWAATSEGRPFVEGCSQAWAGASIAAGTDPTKANDAASRVTEFYSPRSANP